MLMAVYSLAPICNINISLKNDKGYRNEIYLEYNNNMMCNAERCRNGLCMLILCCDCGIIAVSPNWTGHAQMKGFRHCSY